MTVTQKKSGHSMYIETVCIDNVKSDGVIQFQAVLYGPKSAIMRGPERGTRASAKEGFRRWANELGIPRDRWAFYNPR